MIIRWGRKGLFAGALIPTFLTPTPTYINEYQYRPSFKFEFKHVSPPPRKPIPSGGPWRKIRLERELPTFEVLNVSIHITLALKGAGHARWIRGLSEPIADKNLAYANLILFGTARVQQSKQESSVILTFTGKGDNAFSRGVITQPTPLTLEARTQVKWVEPAIPLFKPEPEPIPEPETNQAPIEHHLVTKLGITLKGRGISSYIDGAKNDQDKFTEELEKIIQHTDNPVLPEPNVEHTAANIKLTLEGSATVSVLNNVNPESREDERILLLFAQAMTELDD